MGACGSTNATAADKEPLATANSKSDDVEVAKPGEGMKSSELSHDSDELFAHVVSRLLFLLIGVGYIIVAGLAAFVPPFLSTGFPMYLPQDLVDDAIAMDYLRIALTAVFLIGIGYVPMALNNKEELMFASLFNKPFLLLQAMLAWGLGVMSFSVFLLVLLGDIGSMIVTLIMWAFYPSMIRKEHRRLLGFIPSAPTRNIRSYLLEFEGYFMLISFLLLTIPPIAQAFGSAEVERLHFTYSGVELSGHRLGMFVTATFWFANMYWFYIPAARVNSSGFMAAARQQRLVMVLGWMFLRIFKDDLEHNLVNSLAVFGGLFLGLDLYATTFEDYFRRNPMDDDIERLAAADDSYALFHQAELPNSSRWVVWHSGWVFMTSNIWMFFTSTGFPYLFGKVFPGKVELSYKVHLQVRALALARRAPCAVRAPPPPARARAARGSRPARAHSAPRPGWVRGRALALARARAAQDLLLSTLMGLIAAFLLPLVPRDKTSQLVLKTFTFVLPWSTWWFTVETKLLMHLRGGTPFHMSWVDMDLGTKFTELPVDITFFFATFFMTVITPALLVVLGIYLIGSPWSAFKGMNEAATIREALIPARKVALQHMTLLVAFTGGWMILVSSGLPMPTKFLTNLLGMPPLLPVDTRLAVQVHRYDLLLAFTVPNAIWMLSDLPNERVATFRRVSKLCIFASWGYAFFIKLATHFDQAPAFHQAWTDMYGYEQYKEGVTYFFSWLAFVALNFVAFPALLLSAARTWDGSKLLAYNKRYAAMTTPEVLLWTRSMLQMHALLIWLTSGLWLMMTSSGFVWPLKAMSGGNIPPILPSFGADGANPAALRVHFQDAILGTILANLGVFLQYVPQRLTGQRKEMNFLGNQCVLWIWVLSIWAKVMVNAGEDDMQTWVGIGAFGAWRDVRTLTPAHNVLDFIWYLATLIGIFIGPFVMFYMMRNALGDFAKSLRAARLLVGDEDKAGAGEVYLGSALFLLVGRQIEGSYFYRTLTWISHIVSPPEQQYLTVDRIACARAASGARASPEGRARAASRRGALTACPPAPAPRPRASRQHAGAVEEAAARVLPPGGRGQGRVRLVALHQGAHRDRALPAQRDPARHVCAHDREGSRNLPRDHARARVQREPVVDGVAAADGRDLRRHLPLALRRRDPPRADQGRAQDVQLDAEKGLGVDDERHQPDAGRNQARGRAVAQRQRDRVRPDGAHEGRGAQARVGPLPHARRQDLLHRHQVRHPRDGL